MFFLEEKDQQVHYGCYYSCAWLFGFALDILKESDVINVYCALGNPIILIAILHDESRVCSD
jgi:hypothetical protein